MGFVEIRNLIENHIGDEPLGADGGAIIQGFAAKVMGILAENFALACGGADLTFDAKQDGDVLVRVKSVGNEKWHDDHLIGRCELVPVGDEGCFFHISIGHRSVAGARGYDEVDLVTNRFGGVLVEACAVAGDDERGLGWLHAWCDLFGSAQEKLGHRRMNTDRRAVMKGLAANDGGRAIKPKLSRDHILREIAFADEVRHNIDLVGINHVKGFAQGRFFFPKAAMHLGENPAAADLIGVIEVGRGRIGILRRAMADDEQGAVWLGRDRHAAKLAVFGRIASRGMKCALRNAWQRSYESGVMFARMRVWDDDLPRGGPEAMAIDEWLLESCEEPLLRIYRWSGEWGSLGYFGEIASARSAFPGLQWVRRRTGGGVVDHREDWTYTIIDPAGGPLARAKGDESYRLIHEALAAALNDCGIECRLSAGEGGNDVLACFQNPVRMDVLDANGKKIAGAGQRRTQCGLLHQGSVALGKMPDSGLVENFAMRLSREPEFVQLDPPKAVIEGKIAAMYGCDAWTHRR